MKILLADDHTLFREGIGHILKQLDPGVIVLEAADYRTARDLLDRHPDADLALIDLNMPGENGAGTITTLLSGPQTVPIVVLSASENRLDIRRLLDAGAMGFIPKSETVEVMLGALKLVLSGGVYVPPMLVSQSRNGSSPKSGLTPRQREVMQQMLDGKSNREISRELGLSEATVKVHVTAIFRNLNVNNRMQAARAAEALGFTVEQKP